MCYFCTIVYHELIIVCVCVSITDKPRDVCFSVARFWMAVLQLYL